MRPDTPQHYEYINVENITGQSKFFLFIHPWTQFYKPEQRDDMPTSRCNNITIKNNQVKSQITYDVIKSDKYILKDFIVDSKVLRF